MNLAKIGIDAKLMIKLSITWIEVNTSVDEYFISTLLING
jgi:hypothetical protein